MGRGARCGNDDDPGPRPRLLLVTPFILPSSAWPDICAEADGKSGTLAGAVMAA